MKNVPQNLPVLQNPPLPAERLSDQVFKGGLSLTTMPIRARIVEAFRAPDPWHGGVPAQWTLEVFRMVHSSALPAFTSGKATIKQNGIGAQCGAGEVLGLRNPAENRLRILPRALAQLWQEGQVPTGKLARLSALKEGDLWTKDYVGVTIPKKSQYFFLIPALLFLLLAGVDAFLNRREPVESTPAKWLSTPVTTTGSAYIHEPIYIDGELPIDTVTVPGYTEDGHGHGNVLVWYKAQEGERLALIGPLSAQSLLVYDAHAVSLEGPIIETKDLHLPAPVLAKLVADYPGLQQKYIVCSDWRWFMQRSPLGGVPVLFLGFAGFLGLIWLVFYLSQLRKDRRLASVRRQFLQALGSHA